jgi:hypothetical protein
VTYTGTEEEFPMYKQLTILAFACSLAAGCRDNSTTTPPTNHDLGGSAGGDMTGGTAGGGGTGGDMAAATNFVKTSIASMRGGKPGSFELDNVVVLGITGSAAKPTVYVRDAGTPADFSAMQLTCSATTGTTPSKHPCTVATLIHAAALGQSVTVQGAYIKSTGFEEFYIDGGATAFVAGATGTTPAPVSVTLADVARNNSQSVAKNWFQYVTVSNPGTLDVYDLTPEELVFTNATKCPYQLGFGLIPDGTAGVTAAPACTAKTQPTGITTANANAAEILIATDFYTTYTTSSDCACVTTGIQVTPTQKATALSGILVPDSVFGSSPAVYYQYIAPVVPTDLVLN